MEMNTRIQVEHTVTEMVTGLDLVREQVRIAAGEPLSVRRRTSLCAVTRSSAASMPRTSSSGFLPAPGRITAYEEPSGPGVRVDSGIRAGDGISGLYDPMIAKLIVHDTTRETARARMLRALGELRIEGSRRSSAFTRLCSASRASSTAAPVMASWSRRHWRNVRKR